MIIRWTPLPIQLLKAEFRHLASELRHLHTKAELDRVKQVLKDTYVEQCKWQQRAEEAECRNKWLDLMLDDKLTKVFGPDPRRDHPSGGE